MISFSRLFLTSLLLLVASCSAPVNFYVLAPAGPPSSGGGAGIGVGPVTMADYLTERPSLVFQSSPHKMEMTDEHVWAGDLEQDFAGVLASNLGRRLGTGNTRVYPWMEDQGLAYQVIVDVRQFHGRPDGSAVLEASWRAYRLPESRLITSRTTSLSEPLQKDGFEALAAAQSRLVDRLALRIAEELQP
jgi:uncharacterized lipoprotein YmbA